MQVICVFVYCRNVPLCVQWRRAGGDCGQRVRGRAVDSELRFSGGGFLHLAAWGAAEGYAHERGDRNSALPDVHVRGGWTHYQVEISFPKGNGDQEQTHVSTSIPVILSVQQSFVSKILFMHIQLRVVLQVSRWWKYVRAALVLQLLFHDIFGLSLSKVRDQKPKSIINLGSVYL